MACAFSCSLGAQENKKPGDISLAVGNAAPDPAVPFHGLAVPIEITVTNNTTEIVTFSAANWKQGMGVTVYAESADGRKKAIFPIAKETGQAGFAGNLRMVIIRPGKTEKVTISVPFDLLQPGAQDYFISIKLYKADSKESMEVSSKTFLRPMAVAQ